MNRCPTRVVVLCAAVCTMIFVGFGGAQQAGTTTAKRTLVRAGHLLDVKTGKLTDAQTIVVVRDTIEAIAPSATVSAQPGDRVIDLGGMTVMPGMRTGRRCRLSAIPHRPQ